MNIVVALIALSLLILVHELGHFFAARWAGIRVIEFSIFMGPKLFSIKKGETIYSIRAIPMGGFLKMEGEEEASDDDRAFSKKPVGKRAVVIAAGAFMNIVIAILLFVIISFSVGYSTTEIKELADNSVLSEAGLMQGDVITSYNNKRIFHPNDINMFLMVSEGNIANIGYKRGNERFVAEVTPKTVPPQYRIGFAPKREGNISTNEIDYVEKGSPADTAGMISGDLIIGVNDITIDNVTDFIMFLQENKENPVDIKILRNNDTIIMQEVKPFADEASIRYTLGVSYENKEGGFFEPIKSGFKEAISTIRTVYLTIGWLFTGTVEFGDVSGPVGIVTFIGDIVESSPSFMDKIIGLMALTAFISLNLGVMNLLPFPALDGSKLVILLVEKIRRKPLNPEKEAIISLVGFVLLITLLIFTTYNDILRIVNR